MYIRLQTILNKQGTSPQNHSNKRLGSIGECIAQSYLRVKGYQLLVTNWHAPRRYAQAGELDIVALSPDNLTLVFVEVKTRKPGRLGQGTEAIDRRKQARLSRLAALYLALHPQQQGINCRIDCISICFPAPGKPADIHWLENAFLPEECELPHF